MKTATILPRLIAWVIDALAITVLIFGTQLFLGLIMGVAMGDDGGNPFVALLGVLIIITTLLLQFVYFGYLWSKTGQSLGMRFQNIKVVDAETGQLQPFLKAALRGTVGYYVSGLFFGLGYIWAFIDDNNETWHDKLFNTKVIPA